MKPEILSPAGTPDSLIAALRSGADAVYFGTGNFNARKNAENFDGERLANAVTLCHRQGAKAYITLNTLIKENELPRVMDTVELICRAGVDAVIVQDPGLTSLIRKAAPDLPLHASTQMSIHSPSALPILKKMGFCRVVPSREMSFAELKEFCAAAKKLDIEVEVFVHGALCMCISGQCYMSAMLGGRSGNRGLCAQPCRLPFAANGGKGYDLSLKDLSLREHLKELADIGVDSFKIEGRMKRPEYVAAATAACRSMVECGSIDPSLDSALLGIFSRSGFTTGYFDGDLGPHMFGTRTRDDVQISKEVLTSLHSLYRTERQTVALCGSFTADEKGGVLSLSDGKNQVVATCEVKPDEKDMQSDFVLSKLSKTGGTNYYIKSLDIKLAEKIYISAAELGKARNKCTARLDELRSLPHPYEFTRCDTETYDKAKRPTKFIARFDNKEQIPRELSEISAVSLPLEGDIADVSLPEGITKIVDIPRAIFGKEEYIKRRLSLAREQGFTAAFCGNLAAVALAKEAGFSIIADFGINITNSLSAAEIQSLGASAAVLSFELTADELAAVSSDIPLGAILYGRVPLMITRNCPIKNSSDCKKCARDSHLTDRKGIDFPVRCRLGCGEILNSRPIVLSDRLSEFDLDFAVLYFTTEDKAECARVIADHLYKRSPAGEYTRGLYYRGVE